MLEVDKINTFYGEVQALWDVSLSVKKGEVVCLIGSNGAGKTTTLKTIIGLLHPRSGTIEFFGKRIERWPPHKIVEAGMALVPEGRRLFPYMTVYENLVVGAYTKRAYEKFEDSLEFVYNLFPVLKKFRNRMARTLSGGERQMLAIARALMSRPQLLLMDEPSLGLAPKIVAQVFKVIEDLRNEGITILLVEQNARKALELADRGYVIETGHIVLSGKAEELLANDMVKKAYLGM